MRRAMVMAAILCLAATSGLQGQDGPYRAGKEIAVGGEGGWDYLSVDPAAHRYEPQAPGSKERPKAVAGTFRILVYQTGAAK